jgi:mRNA-degrading endonuclease RelE of RelBE toxin-antitoxin system
MTYELVATATLKKALQQHRRDRALLDAVDTKLARLRADPHHVGKPLAGQLHGFHTTRLVKNFRLLFTIDVAAHTVTLEALDHRKDVYD